MLHKIFMAILLCIFISGAANAKEFLKKYVPNAQVSGSDRYTYMIFDVYDATLYAPMGKWKEEEPYALSLKYLRTLKGEKIAEKSIQEIRSQGYDNEIKLAAWFSQMKKILPDVENGTVLTGIYIPGKETRFYKDNAGIGVIKDPEFGRWFFGIWLADTTTAPKLRQNLTGRR